MFLTLMPTLNYAQFISSMGIASKFITNAGNAMLRSEEDTLNSKFEKETAVIHFDLGSTEITSEMKLALDSMVEVLNSYPDKLLKITAHTDNRASNNYNLVLSQKRAESTLAYLESKGISRKRVRVKSFGENVPLIDCNSATFCTEEQQMQNRRVELSILYPTSYSSTTLNHNTYPNVVYHVQLIISDIQISNFCNSINGENNIFREYNSDGYYSYYSGVFSHHLDAEKHMNELAKKGYKGYVVAFKNEQRVVLK